MEHFDERKNNPTSVIADGRKQFLYNRTKTTLERMSHNENFINRLVEVT